MAESTPLSKIIRRVFAGDEGTAISTAATDQMIDHIPGDLRQRIKVFHT